MNERFTDEQAREIKINLLAGVGISTLARRWNTSAETISKMKRGLTYRHVKVAGEERLRPEIEVVGLDHKVREKAFSMVTDEEIDAQAQAMWELQQQINAQKQATDAVKELTEAEKYAQELLGVQVKPRGDF